MPLRIPVSHDVRYMDRKAEADWCPCRDRVDGLIATDGRCEEWHLFGKVQKRQARIRRAEH